MQRFLKYRRQSLPLLALLLLHATPAVANEELDRVYDRGTLVIETGGSGCYAFDVWLAISRPQQRRGLMHVRDLQDFAGMLFVYGEPGIRSMWMKNTYIPLDMLFIRDDGTVESIAAHTEPLSLRSVSSDGPVTYVLELNAGTAERLRIRPGSRVHLPEGIG